MIKDHEIILWIEDLNCWMDSLDWVKVKNRLAKELMKVLNLKNQLNQQKEKRRIFLRFRQKEIESISTFKYDTGPAQVEYESSSCWGTPWMHQAGCIYQVFSTYVESLSFPIQFSKYLSKRGSEQFGWDSITFPDPRF